MCIRDRHSHDSVCYHIGNYLFTGDSFIPNIRTVSKLKEGNRDEAADTVRYIVKTFDRNTFICPGHKEVCYLKAVSYTHLEKDCQDGFSMFEALKLLLDYAFLQLNMNRITASCLPDHFLAPYSLGAFGFEKEGRMHECIYKNGSYQDMDLYALLRKKYDKIESDGGYSIKSLVRRCIKLRKEEKS